MKKIQAFKVHKVRNTFSWFVFIIETHEVMFLLIHYSVTFTSTNPSRPGDLKEGYNVPLYDEEALKRQPVRSYFYL